MRTLSLFLATLFLAVPCFAQLSGTDASQKAAQRIQSSYGVWLDPAKFSLAELLNVESRISVAVRVKRTFGISFDPSALSLSQLLDVESRLSTCARIEKAYGLRFDYINSPLADLLDVESRLSLSSRIKRSYNVDVGYRDHSASQLLDIESRLSSAQRIQRDHGIVLDWKSLSTTQLLAAESQLRQSQASAQQPTVASSNWPQYYSTPPTTAKPSTSSEGGRYYDPTYRPSVGDHYVRGYTRSDGTYVPGHYRTNRDDSFWNNYSSYGNINPYTGRTGYKLPPIRSYGGGSTYVNGYFRRDGTYVSGHYRSR